MQKTGLALPLLLTLLVPTVALADVPRVVSGALAAAPQDDEDDLLDEELEEEEGIESDAVGDKPEEGEVDYGGADVGDDVGGATGFVRHSGFYTSSDLGGFLRFGGFTTSNQGLCSHPAAACEPRITSNLQPWIKLAVGYDVVNVEAFQFSTQLSLGTGFVANAAPIENLLDSPRDYAVSMVNVELIGTFFVERLGISGKLFGGGAFLTPAPQPDVSPAGGVVGGGLGVSWATLLTDVTIGVDINGMFIMAGQTAFAAMSFAPVIKYTF
jgi:hypothetical protein